MAGLIFPNTLMMSEIIVLMIIFVSVVLIKHYLVEDSRRWTDPNSYQKTPSLTSLVHDIGVDIVPPMQSFYLFKDGSNYDKLGDKSSLNSTYTTGDCVQQWGALLRQKLLSNMTDPVMSTRLLKSWGLSNYLPVSSLLSDYLTTPQPFEPFLQMVENTTCQNIFFQTMACHTLDDVSLHIDYSRQSPQRFAYTLQSAITNVMMMEVLILECNNDPKLLQGILRQLTTTMWQPVLQSKVIQQAPSEDFKNFIIRKINSLYAYAESQSKIIISDRAAPELKTGLQLNILEAALYDYQTHKIDNTKVGLLVAAHTSHLCRYKDLAIETYFHKTWIHMYNSWNFAYVMHPGVKIYYWILLLPSVSGEVNPNRWLQARELSLILALTSHHIDPLEPFGVYGNTRLQEVWADNTLRYSELPIPGREAMKEMFTEICPSLECYPNRRPEDNSGIFDFPIMSTNIFQMYAILSITITLMIAGVCLEYVTLDWWTSLNEDDLLNYEFAVEVFFPFMLVVSLYSRSALGFPFVVLGLFKFGYPENIGYLVKTRSLIRQGKYSQALRFYVLCQATLMHHFCSFYTLAAVAFGKLTLSVRIISCLIPLVVQHWMNGVRFVSIPLAYTGIIIIEAIFEWQVISNLRYVHLDAGGDYNIPGVATMMLVAHWLYMIIGFIKLFSDMYRSLKINKYFTRFKSKGKVNKSSENIVMDIHEKVSTDTRTATTTTATTTTTTFTRTTTNSTTHDNDMSLGPVIDDDDDVENSKTDPNIKKSQSRDEIIPRLEFPTLQRTTSVLHTQRYTALTSPRVLLDPFENVVTFIKDDLAQPHMFHKYLRQRSRHSFISSKYAP